MDFKRCENGHYYDPSRHSSCPNCGINIDLDLGISAEMDRTTPKQDEGHTGARGSSGSEGKTVGLYNKKLGVDPVVGWLICIEGTDRGRDYRLRNERNFIGRSERMNVCITGDPTISRENHAIISYNPRNNSYKVSPGENRGLVYLNNEEVDIPKELKPYDKIELGQTKLIFVPLCGERFKWE
jgi:hypothetical protein